MKNECQRTRAALPKYLSGHLFKTSQKRIERHLQQCVVCRSEFEALRRVEETKQILKDINAPEDVVGLVKEHVSSLGKLKKILYRPLWIAGLVLVLAGIYYYIVTPKQLDLEIERIVTTAPSTTALVETKEAHETGPAAKPAAVAQREEKPVKKENEAVAPAPAPEPLVISLTPENDDESVRRINEILRGHGQLRSMKFTESVKEIYGSLTAKELQVLFNRVEETAKVSYSRKRFHGFPDGAPIPFVLRLKPAPKPVEQPAPVAKPAPEPLPGTQHAESPPSPPQPAPSSPPQTAPARTEPRPHSTVSSSVPASAPSSSAVQ